MLSTQTRLEWHTAVTNNQHEIYVVSLEEMDRIVKISGADNSKVQAAWANFRKPTEIGAGNLSTANDTAMLAKLLRELGAAGSQAYVKTYGGKVHIVLKGYPGLRRVLTSPKYAITNTKVITMGLGRTGAAHAIKSGGILTVVLMSAYRIADYVLTDKITLTRLIGQLAVDVVNIGIGCGLSFAAIPVGVAIAGIALGPLVAVVAVGLFMALVISPLDDQYGISDRVVDAIEARLDSLENNIKDAKRSVGESIQEARKQAIDYIVKSGTRFIIDWTRHQLNPYVMR